MCSKSVMLRLKLFCSSVPCCGWVADVGLVGSRSDKLFPDNRVAKAASNVAQHHITPSMISRRGCQSACWTHCPMSSCQAEDEHKVAGDSKT